jgi:uncharacterized membrane protein
MDRIKNLIDAAGNVLSLALDCSSMVCIVIGFISAILYTSKTLKVKSSPLHTRVKLKFGGWLALALEFQLGSDIVMSTISPTYEHLIRLGALAVIRTFLNYFLTRELNEEMELRKNMISSADIAEGTPLIQKPSTLAV